MRESREGARELEVREGKYGRKEGREGRRARRAGRGQAGSIIALWALLLWNDNRRQSLNS